MIIFFHVPGFYAAVEQADNPSLRGQPVIVGGNPRKGGNVTSATGQARERGVEPGMPVQEALERCPGAAFRPTRLRRYREVAREKRAILRTAIERLEEEGLDITYLEAPSRSDPTPLAAELCVRVHADLGIRAVAGIGSTRFVAFLAGQDPGASGIRQVPRDGAREFLAPHPVSVLWGLGPATAEKLSQHGIATIGDLQQLALAEIEALVGRNAPGFHALARAEERSPLRPSPRVKSLSQELTLPESTADVGLLSDRLLDLAGRLESLLGRERRLARTVSLSLRYVDETQGTRTRTLPQPVNTQNEIHAVALELLSRTHAGARLVRRVRLQVANLIVRRADADPRQLRLF